MTSTTSCAADSTGQKPNFVKDRVLVFILLLIPILRNSVFQRRRDTDAYSSIDIYNIVDIFAVLLLMLFSLRHFSKIFIFLKYSSLRFFFIYYFFCAFSLLWSVRLELFYTPYRSMEMLVMGVESLYLIWTFSTARNAYKAMLWFCSIIWVPKVVQLFLLTRSFELSDYHTNTYTIYAMLGLILSVGGYRSGVFSFKAMLLPILLSIGGLLIGTSSASFLSAIVGLAVLYASRREKVSFFKLVIVLGILYVMYNLFSESIMDFIFPGKDIDNILSGTGRTNMWEYYIEAWFDAPFLGYGFPVGEKEAQLFGWVQTSSSHNSFLSVLINTGAIGMVIFGVFVIGMLLECQKSASVFKNPYAVPVLAAFLSAISNSMSFPMIGSTWTFATPGVLFLLAFAAIWLHPLPTSGNDFRQN